MKDTLVSGDGTPLAGTKVNVLGRCCTGTVNYRLLLTLSNGPTKPGWTSAATVPHHVLR